MPTASKASTSSGGYVLGHSPGEIDRLKAQARLIDPITKKFFQQAGIGAGMRVLDVGSGAGDVAFLAADLVGAAGTVVGVDRVSSAIDEARNRATARGLKNVSFRVGDPAEIEFEQPFDAVIGRYVLQFQPDPSTMLRKLAARVRPGGVIVFHEIDWGGLRSYPPVASFDRCSRWGAETLRLHGTESQMGVKLHATFVGAGLSPPAMRLEALVGGGPKAVDILSLLAGVIETLLPELERLGVATPAEVGIDSLVARMNEEMVKQGSAVIGHNQIAAWSRT